MIRPLIIAACLLVAAPLGAREQSYSVDLTDYSLIASVKALFDGEPLAEGIADTPKLGLSALDVLKFLKERDVEFMLRARPAWRADGDRLKKSRGFYSVRVYFWETLGPIAHLDYRLEMFGGAGASTRIKSSVEFDLRHFSWRGGDRLVFTLANIRPIHRIINNAVERAVHAAEFGLIHGYALADHARRDREREERRKKAKEVELIPDDARPCECR